MQRSPNLTSRWCWPRSVATTPVELLAHLDYGLIRANPKVFQGYSDLTVLHWALLQRSGLVSFYGPALLPELGEYPTVLPYTDRWLRAAWFGTAPLQFAAAVSWTDEFLDWDWQQDRTRPRDLRPSEGWVTISPSSPTPACSSRSLVWWWLGRTGMTSGRRFACGPSSLAGRRHGACPCSPTWIAATPIPC